MGVVAVEPATRLGCMAERKNPVEATIANVNFVSVSM